MKAVCLRAPNARQSPEKSPGNMRDSRQDDEDREVERAMRKSHFSEEQIIGILRLAEAGQTVAEVCRQQGISEGT